MDRKPSYVPGELAIIGPAKAGPQQHSEDSAALYAASAKAQIRVPNWIAAGDARHGAQGPLRPSNKGVKTGFVGVNPR